MKIIVNDANILIDLAKLDLIEKLSELGAVLHTNDFVLEEIEDDVQREKIDFFVSEKIITVANTGSEEIIVISQMVIENKGLSFEDCSIWHYTKKCKGLLLTGDKKLKSCVEKDGIEVRGIIYVLDELLHKNIISKETAIIKIKQLYRFNKWLPEKEIEARINKWQDS